MLQLQRGLQLLAAGLWITLSLVLGMYGFVLYFCLVYFSSSLRYPLLVYGIWILIDYKKGLTGKNRSRWVRNWTLWKYLRDYFPAKLHKTAELPSDQNYMFVIFPHGMLCTGAFLAFATDVLGFTKVFPGITISVVSLYRHYITPFMRELTTRFGSLPASEYSIRLALTKKPNGRAIALIAGGAQEAFYCKPGLYKIVLRKRKGFVRIALSTGTSLVPVISFGETDLYDQVDNPPGSWLRTFQEWYKKVTGIAFIIMLGRGFFQERYGVIPRRKPLNVVVGEPITVKQIGDPSEQQINELHSQFIDSLQNLFETEKYKYIQNAANTKLIIT